MHASTQSISAADTRTSAASVVIALLVVACAPLTRTTTTTEPIVTVHDTATIDTNQGKMRVRANRRGGVLTVDAHDALICRVQRSEVGSARMITTVEPSKTVIAGEVALAIVGFATAGWVLATGEWRDAWAGDSGAGGGDSFPFLVMVGIPVATGTAASYAAFVDASSSEYKEQPVRRSYALPPAFAVCTDAMLAGRELALRQDARMLNARFGLDGTARFQLDAATREALALNPVVEILIDQQMLGRVHVEQLP